MKLINKVFVSRAFQATMLALGVTGAATFITNAQAADADNSVQDSVVYWGADVKYGGSRSYATSVDAGLVTALNGNIETSGWILSGNAGYGYSKEALSKTNSVYTSVLFGHLWNMPGFYFSLSGGGLYLNNDETPPGSRTDGDKLGALFQYGFETTSVDAFYVQSYGSVSTAYTQLYLHAKVGYKSSTLRYGAEFTLSDDKTSRGTRRFGGFVGDIPLGEDLSMVVSAGYQQNRDPGEKDGAYATIGFAVPFSLR